MPAHNFAKLFVAVGLMSAATPAPAYIDPGTGAMVVQAILALCAAVIFYFRNPAELWRDLQNWLKRFHIP